VTPSYDRRQAADDWPRRGRWNPADLPDWYLDLLGCIVASTTDWRQDAGIAPLDPRFDPRVDWHAAPERRSA
jgi:hypothetical protein